MRFGRGLVELGVGDERVVDVDAPFDASPRARGLAVGASLRWIGGAVDEYERFEESVANGSREASCNLAHVGKRRNPRNEGWAAPDHVGRLEPSSC